MNTPPIVPDYCEECRYCIYSTDIEFKFANNRFDYWYYCKKFGNLKSYTDEKPAFCLHFKRSNKGYFDSKRKPAFLNVKDCVFCKYSSSWHDSNQQVVNEKIFCSKLSRALPLIHGDLLSYCDEFELPYEARRIETPLNIFLAQAKRDKELGKKEDYTKSFHNHLEQQKNEVVSCMLNGLPNNSTTELFHLIINPNSQKKRIIVKELKGKAKIQKRKMTDLRKKIKELTKQKSLKEEKVKEKLNLEKNKKDLDKIKEEIKNLKDLKKKEGEEREKIKKDLQLEDNIDFSELTNRFEFKKRLNNNISADLTNHIPQWLYEKERELYSIKISDQPKKSKKNYHPSLKHVINNNFELKLLPDQLLLKRIISSIPIDRNRGTLIYRSAKTLYKKYVKTKWRIFFDNRNKGIDQYNSRQHTFNFPGIQSESVKIATKFRFKYIKSKKYQLRDQQVVFCDFHPLSNLTPFQQAFIYIKYMFNNPELSKKSKNQIGQNININQKAPKIQKETSIDDLSIMLGIDQRVIHFMLLHLFNVHNSITDGTNKEFFSDDYNKYKNDLIIIYVIQFKIFLSSLLSFYFLTIFVKLS